MLIEKFEALNKEYAAPSSPRPRSKSNSPKNLIIASPGDKRSPIWEFWQKMADSDMQLAAEPPSPLRRASISRPTKGPAEKDFRKETINIWSKPLSQLPVHTDLPRLVHVISVHGPDNENIEVIEAPDIIDGEKHQTKNSLFTVLIKLAYWLETEEKVNQIKDKYDQYITGDESYTGGFSRQLSSFLDQVVGGDRSRTVKVLKACHQAIIAPTIIEFRLRICPHLPFKDAGGWRIRVHIHADSVTITHSKKQRHLDPMKLDEQFEFEWAMKLTLPPTLDVVKDVSLTITSLTFGENTSSSKQKEIQELFKNYMRQR